MLSTGNTVEALPSGHPPLSGQPLLLNGHYPLLGGWPLYRGSTVVVSDPLLKVYDNLFPRVLPLHLSRGMKREDPGNEVGCMTPRTVMTFFGKTAISNVFFLP